MCILLDIIYAAHHLWRFCVNLHPPVNSCPFLVYLTCPQTLSITVLTSQQEQNLHPQTLGVTNSMNYYVCICGREKDVSKITGTILTLFWLFLVSVKVTALWNVMPCSSLISNVLEEPSSSIHLEDQPAPRKWSLSTKLYCIMSQYHIISLRYKSEGRGFDSRWCHWNFSLT
jgi:hypothetical protein